MEMSLQLMKTELLRLNIHTAILKFIILMEVILMITLTDQPALIILTMAPEAGQVRMVLHQSGIWREVQLPMQMVL
jgi:hypothetical protein